MFKAFILVRNVESGVEGLDLASSQLIALGFDSRNSEKFSHL